MTATAPAHEVGSDLAAEINLKVGNLTPGTRYFYAVKAQNEAGVAGAFATVAVVTADVEGVCAAVASPSVGQVLYPGRQYHLAAVPAGTTVSSGSPLYGWLDQGAGGEYTVLDPSQPLSTAGQAFWTWSRCDRLVDLAPSGDGFVSLPLGAYRASMVGNPSATSAATVSGHDFAAGWDPALNDGAGGYHISDYREPQNVAVGAGIWTFSFVPTEVRIEVAG
ncbi:MAG TPA: hypothetical protein VM142_02640 [Acidimicrobiales bacterium]|nr:hypothetical protein [Acidimicrobiales bacterium]